MEIGNLDSFKSETHSYHGVSELNLKTDEFTTYVPEIKSNVKLCRYERNYEKGVNSWVYLD
jgi:hypothetical protein